MTFTVYLSGHMKTYSGGATEISLPGDFKTVGDLLDGLWTHQVALRDRILNEQGEIRQHMNIFYDGEDVRRQNGLQTKLGAETELHIFNAVSGG